MLICLRGVGFAAPGNDSVSSRIKDSGQLLVVIPNKVHARSGTLYFFQKMHGVWIQQLEPVQVMLGAHGLAWAEDLSGLFRESLPRKKEGDLCSPAGIYAINEAFSFDSIPISVNLLILTKGSLCIDDMKSSWYNQVVDSSKIRKNWHSAENMRSVPGYKYGLIIDNSNGQSAGKNGSCIFVHIWSGQGRSTAGCTAMKESDLINIIKLLDKRFLPVIVQLPLNTYKKYRNRLGFPAI